MYNRPFRIETGVVGPVFPRTRALPSIGGVGGAMQAAPTAAGGASRAHDPIAAAGGAYELNIPYWRARVAQAAVIPESQRKQATTLFASLDAAVDRWSAAERELQLVDEVMPGIFVKKQLFQIWLRLGFFDQIPGPVWVGDFVDFCLGHDHRGPHFFEIFSDLFDEVQNSSAGGHV